MAIKMIAAGSTSAHYHLYLGYGAPNQAVSVSTGLANSRTMLIPVHSDNIRFTFNGTFGSGSASTQIVIDVCPDNSGAVFFPILTVSAPQTTILPMMVDHIIRLRQQWTSAAVAVTNASVDAWIG
jgi:hypothetical protein